MLGQKQCVKCEILPGTVYLLKVSEKSVSIILPAWTPACFLDVWFLPPDCLWVMLLGLSLFCPTTITVQSDQASQLWVSLARVAIHWHEQHLPFMGWGASRSSRFENNLWTDQLALHSQSAAYGSVSTRHSSSAPFSQHNAIPLLLVHATLSHPVLPRIWAPAFSLWTVSGGLRHSDKKGKASTTELNVVFNRAALGREAAWGLLGSRRKKGDWLLGQVAEIK